MIVDWHTTASGQAYSRQTDKRQTAYRQPSDCRQSADGKQEKTDRR